MNTKLLKRLNKKAYKKYGIIINWSYDWGKRYFVIAYSKSKSADPEILETFYDKDRAIAYCDRKRSIYRNDLYFKYRYGKRIY